MLAHMLIFELVRLPDRDAVRVASLDRPRICYDTNRDLTSARGSWGRTSRWR